MPLPGDETLPETDDSPLLGSGLSFLKAPSAGIKGKCVLNNFINGRAHAYEWDEMSTWKIEMFQARNIPIIYH